MSILQRIGRYAIAHERNAYLLCTFFFIAPLLTWLAYAILVLLIFKRGWIYAAIATGSMVAFRVLASQILDHRNLLNAWWISECLFSILTVFLLAFLIEKKQPWHRILAVIASFNGLALLMVYQLVDVPLVLKNAYAAAIQKAQSSQMGDMRPQIDFIFQHLSDCFFGIKIGIKSLVAMVSVMVGRLMMYGVDDAHALFIHERFSVRISVGYTFIFLLIVFLRQWDHASVLWNQALIVVMMPVFFAGVMMIHGVFSLCKGFSFFLKLIFYASCALHFYIMCMVICALACLDSFFGLRFRRKFFK